MLFPKAVDWDLFRTDVIGMCDTAEKRDMECDDGSSGTISYACKKIKEMLEQVYEKTGKRQLNEIRAANTRHRFASAIESCSNNEAAVQGRWRKEGKRKRRIWSRNCEAYLTLYMKTSFSLSELRTIEDRCCLRWSFGIR